MFKHTVEYTDFNGSERKEDLYFHLSTPELLRLEAEVGKSLEDYIKEVSDNQKLDELLAFLEKMILSSYGQKTTDGKSFYKTKEIRQEFEYSQAYAELFEQLILQPDLARKFGENVADKSKSRKNEVMPKVVKQIPEA